MRLKDVSIIPRMTYDCQSFSFPGYDGTLELDPERLGVLGQPQLQSEFEESLGNTRHCHTHTQKKKNRYHYFFLFLLPLSWWSLNPGEGVDIDIPFRAESFIVCSKTVYMESIVAGIAATRPAKDQAGHAPNREGRGAPEAPPLTEEPRKKKLSSGMHSLEGHLCSSTHPSPTHLHTQAALSGLCV